MKDSFFKEFILVGGTALSLLIGHRISIDLDFFISKDFDENLLVKHLQDNYAFELDYLSKNTVKGESNNTQLDFIAHKYPIVVQHKIYENIRIASFEEIIAMKINAIATNGTRIKDFIDISFLSKYYSLNNMLSIYEKKYNANKFIALKSICYFDDINKDEPIKYINKNFSFNDIKNHILAMIENPETSIQYIKEEKGKIMR